MAISDPKRCAILVATTDSFEDVWEPFLILFKRYWPDCPYPIYLNSETKSYQGDTLKVTSLQIASKCQSKPPTWSEMYLRAIDAIPERYVLFMLDDFFITRPVDVDIFEKCLDRMERGDVANIVLSAHDNHRPATPTDDPLFDEVSQDARYRLTTSPALWDKERLKTYIDPSENAWQFEVFGSQRARKIKDCFLTMNSERFRKDVSEVISYWSTNAYDTTIVKGKWQKECVEFFAKEKLDIDLTKRGFFVPLPGYVNKYHVMKRLASNPRQLVRYLVGRIFG